MKPPRFPNPHKKQRRPRLWVGLLVGVAVVAFGLLLLHEQATRLFTPHGGPAEAASPAAAGGVSPGTASGVSLNAANGASGAAAGNSPIPTATGGGKTANADADRLDTNEYPAGRLADGLSFDRFHLEKSKRRLTAFAEGRVVRVYTVALGEQPVGAKRFQGDMKTPEGTYTINDKNPHSAYYKNVGISYPNKADREYARRHGKSAGGDIKIHGLAPAFASIGKAHRETDWTYGCIAVTNPEMEEIYTRTPVGTPIEIVP